MQDEMFKSEWRSVNDLWDQYPLLPALLLSVIIVCDSVLSGLVLWHFSDFGPIFQDWWVLLLALSSPYIAQTIIAFLIYTTSVYELLAFSCLKQLWQFLFWNDISMCSLPALFSLLEMFCVSCMKSNNSFDTWPHRLLTSQFSFISDAV